MNARTAIFVILLWQFVYAEALLPFWGVIRNIFIGRMFFNARNKGIATKISTEDG